ncbi:MAG: phage tail protein [Eubacteriales bacterium]|nr:phage tail protein [Eubacteriales bacterium]
MPDVNITIDEAQVAHVNKMLHTMPDKAKIVFRNAMNRGLIAARTQAAKEIKERYDIKTGNLRTYQTIKLRRAGQAGSDIVGEITFSGTKIPLYRFHPSPATRRYTNRYVNGKAGAKITAPVSATDARESGKHKLNRGFIATFSSGHTGIFYRTNGKTRTGKTKLKEYFGFSVADMLAYEPAMDAVYERAQEITSKSIDHELYRILNGF